MTYSDTASGLLKSCASTSKPPKSVEVVDDVSFVLEVRDDVLKAECVGIPFYKRII